ARYARDVNVQGITISFVDGGGGNDQIADSGDGLAVFSVGEVVKVSGSTDNDGLYTILAVAAGTLDVPTGSLTTEPAGDDVTLTNAPTTSSNWLYLYSPKYDMIQAGEFLANLRRIASLAELSADEQIKIAWRAGPDSTAEESADWGDGTGTRSEEEILLNDLATWGEFPFHARPDQVQFRIGFQRGTSNTLTPILSNLFAGVATEEGRAGI
ncbi:MAG: hypothetical protein JSW71_07540, partial [Gemmatimonadota bacterium]